MKASATKKLSRSQIDAILSMAENPTEFVYPGIRGKYRWNANTGLSLKRFGIAETKLRNGIYAFRLWPSWIPSAVELLQRERGESR